MPASNAIIQHLLAPVVLISACGLLCLALYNRLAVVVNRLRAFHHERIGLLERIGNLSGKSPDSLTATLLAQRLTMLEKQGDHLLGRARLVRGALVGLVICVLCMLGCSMCLGLSLTIDLAGVMALLLFMIGIASAAVGMILALRELLRCLSPVALEAVSMEHLRSLPGYGDRQGAKTGAGMEPSGATHAKGPSC